MAAQERFQRGPERFLRGLKSLLRGLKPLLRGLESLLRGLEHFLPGLKPVLSFLKLLVFCLYFPEVLFNYGLAGHGVRLALSKKFNRTLKLFFIHRSSPVWDRKGDSILLQKNVRRVWVSR